MILETSQDTAGWQLLPYLNGQAGHAVKLMAEGGVSLACSSSKFCMVFTQDELYFTWDGSGWTQHQWVTAASLAGTGLTCPTDGFCLAIGQDGSQGTASIIEYKNLAWTQTLFNSENQVLIDISCASATYCYLLGNDGDAWRFNGTGWSGPVPVTVSDSQGSADPVDAIGCAPGPYCIAVGENGGGLLADSGSGFSPLSAGAIFNGSGTNIRGACGTANFCLVQPQGPDGPTGYAVLDGSSFEHIAQPATPPTGVALSCTPERFCMNNITNTDQVVTYNGA